MLSENLKRHREEKGYSKLRLAREAGISARCIEHIEFNRARNPRVGTLRKIAEVLNVSIEELIK